MSRTYRRKEMSGYHSWCSDSRYIQRNTTPGKWYDWDGNPRARYDTLDECLKVMWHFHIDKHSGAFNVPKSFRALEFHRPMRAECRDSIRHGMRLDDWDERIIYNAKSHSLGYDWW